MRASAPALFGLLVLLIGAAALLLDDRAHQAGTLMLAAAFALVSLSLVQRPGARAQPWRHYLSSEALDAVLRALLKW